MSGPNKPSTIKLISFAVRYLPLRVPCWQGNRKDTAQFYGSRMLRDVDPITRITKDNTSSTQHPALSTLGLMHIDTHLQTLQFPCRDDTTKEIPFVTIPTIPSNFQSVPVSVAIRFRHAFRLANRPTGEQPSPSAKGRENRLQLLQSLLHRCALGVDGLHLSDSLVLRSMVHTNRTI